MPMPIEKLLALLRGKSAPATSPPKAPGLKAVQASSSVARKPGLRLVTKGKRQAGL